MTTATRSQQATARWLLTAELEDAEGALAGPVVAERVFEKLSHRLARLIAPVGCEALLARALHLSRAEFPVLDGVEITPGADAVAVRFRDGAIGVGSNQACEAFTAMLGASIALLAIKTGSAMWR